MVASAKVGGRRLIGVINGFNGKGHDALANEMKKLLEHGFTTTTNKTFFQPGDKIADVPVWYGKQKTVVATVEKPFTATLDKDTGLDGVRVLVRYNEPIAAPVKAGDKIGEIIAEKNGDVIVRAPVVAKDTVKKIQFLGRVFQNIKVIFGWE